MSYIGMCINPPPDPHREEVAYLREEIAAILRANAELRTECTALRAALRGQVVDRTGGYGRCVLCEHLWPYGEPERHYADCLATLAVDGDRG